MPSQDDHIQQWRHNRVFIGEIPLAYHDWIVTAAFYTALHAVDALLAFDKTAVTNHEGRNIALRTVRRYEKIQQHYDPLYSLSRTIRYLAKPAVWVPADQVQAQVIGRHLYPIEQSVQKLIGRDLQLPPIRLKPAM